jgi:hypothetical protein
MQDSDLKLQEDICTINEVSPIWPNRTTVELVRELQLPSGSGANDSDWPYTHSGYGSETVQSREAAK